MPIGNWVNCQLSISTKRIVPHPITNKRVSYCLLTPSELERRHSSLMVDSLSRRGSPYTGRRPRSARGNVSRSQESGSEEGIKLPDISKLNLSVRGVQELG